MRINYCCKESLLNFEFSLAAVANHSKQKNKRQLAYFGYVLDL
jgi:hypothetical protein